MDDNKYIGWKNWSEKDFGLVKPGRKFYFDQIFKPKLLEKSRVLEVGFGNGELLGYFGAQGHDVVGVEINDVLTTRANKLGYVAYTGAVWEIAELLYEKFDQIVAFNVLEHMNHENLYMFFLWARKHLDDDGRLYLQFPEGASPFGLANQNGDFTHVTSLTREKIEVLCNASKMRVLSYSDDPLTSNKLCSFGLPGKIALLFLQGYASVVKWALRILLWPLATSLRFGTNSIAVVVIQKGLTEVTN
jgi:SAM-dependent methyltransferase